jgi:hypothetical protein
MSQRDSAGSILAWLSHPVSLAGLGLLLLNDHVFKQLWPGTVTGKLSDLAGMVMFPPLLAAIVSLCVPRMPAKILAVTALLLTGLGFSLVKLDSGLSAAVSGWLSAVAGPSLLRADSTDLLALPALGLAWLAFQRARRRPVATRTARTVRAAVLIPVALLGTLATSKADVLPPPALAKSDDGRLWYDNRHVSTDGGRTFRQEHPEVPVSVLTQDCAGQTCYRVVPGELRVESSHDGGRSWATSWQATWGQRRDLVAGEASGGNAASDGWESLSLAVAAMPGTSAGHTVLLANGRAGLWLRDGEGTWTRAPLRWRGEVAQPMPGAAHLSQGVFPGGEAYFFVTMMLLVLLLGSVSVIALRARAPWRLSGWAVAFAPATLVAVAGETLVLRWGEGAPAALVVASAALAAACLGLAAWLFLRYRPSIPVSWLIAMLAIAGLATWWLELMRANSAAMFDILNGVVILGFLRGPFALPVLLAAFTACLLTGLRAERWPRPPAP